MSAAYTFTFNKCAANSSEFDGRLWEKKNGISNLPAGLRPATSCGSSSSIFDVDLFSPDCCGSSSAIVANGFSFNYTRSMKYLFFECRILSIEEEEEARKKNKNDGWTRVISKHVYLARLTVLFVFCSVCVWHLTRMHKRDWKWFSNEVGNDGRLTWLEIDARG